MRLPLRDNHLGIAVEASFLRSHLDQLHLKERKTVDRGTKPGDDPSTESWDVKNWNRLDRFVELFFILLDKIKLEQKTPYFHYLYPELDSFYYPKALYDRNMLLILPYERDDVKLTSPYYNTMEQFPALKSYVSIELQQWVPYYSSPGYYDDPKDFPGPNYTLVNRKLMFHYQMLQAVLPEDGTILLSENQARSLKIDDKQPWPASFYPFVLPGL